MGAFVVFDDPVGPMEWWSGRWVFDAIVEHAMASIGDNDEVKHAFDAALVYSHVDLLDLQRQGKDLFRRVLAALLQAGREAAAGGFDVSIEGRRPDDEMQVRFRSESQRLVDMLLELHSRVSRES